MRPGASSTRYERGKADPAHPLLAEKGSINFISDHQAAMDPCSNPSVSATPSVCRDWIITHPFLSARSSDLTAAQVALALPC